MNSRAAPCREGLCAGSPAGRSSTSASTQHALEQVHDHVSVFSFGLRCDDFYSNELVLDHVIKLFIVLYHAVKHGDLGWMLCVWTVVFLFFKLVRWLDGPE